MCKSNKAPGARVWVLPVYPNLKEAKMRKAKVLLVVVMGIFLLSATGGALAYTVKTPQKVYKGTLTGLVEVSTDGQVYVTTKWRSRSRASYKVTGPLTEEVAQYKGQVIKVEGMITRDNPWRGTIEAEKILEVVGAPQDTR